MKYFTIDDVRQGQESAALVASKSKVDAMLEEFWNCTQENPHARSYEFLFYRDNEGDDQCCDILVAELRDRGFVPKLVENNMSENELSENEYGIHISW